MHPIINGDGKGVEPHVCNFVVSNISTIGKLTGWFREYRRDMIPGTWNMFRFSMPLTPSFTYIVMYPYMGYLKHFLVVEICPVTR